MSRILSLIAGAFYTPGGDVPIPEPKVNVRTQYDKVGEDYVKAQREFIKKNGDFATDFILDAVGDLNGKTLLDVGCCAGDHLAIYESRGASVFGVEPSAKMLEIAATQIKDQSNLKRGGSDDIPFSDNEFDVVTARLSLHYIPNLDDAWGEIGRVIRPGGVLAYVTPHPFNTSKRIGRRDYGEVSQIGYKLLNKVGVINYHHPLQGIFSPEFFDRFVIEDFNEFLGQTPRVKSSKGPSAFGIKARRRE